METGTKIKVRKIKLDDERIKRGINGKYFFKCNRKTGEGFYGDAEHAQREQKAWAKLGHKSIIVQDISQEFDIVLAFRL